MLGSFDSGHAPPLAVAPALSPTVAVAVELIGVPANVVTQALIAELATVGFQTADTTGRRVALTRADGAAVSLAEETIPLENGVTQLILGTRHYPLDNAVDAVSRGLGAAGYTMHASSEAFVLSHRSGLVVRIGRQPSAGLTTTEVAS
jgi:hypothetical protein